MRKRSDGSPVYVSLSVSPLRNAAGEVIGASKIARDITGRKKAASALAERNLQLALAERAALVNRPQYCNAMGDFWRWPLAFTTSRGHACSISARGKTAPSRRQCCLIALHHKPANGPCRHSLPVAVY